MHLCDAHTIFRSERSTAKARKLLERPAFIRLRDLLSTFGQIAIVLRQYLAALVFLDVATPNDPITPQCGQTLANITFRPRIGPNAARVIHPDGLILLQSPVKILGR